MAETSRPPQGPGGPPGDPGPKGPRATVLPPGVPGNVDPGAGFTGLMGLQIDEASAKIANSFVARGVRAGMKRSAN